jgi:glucokinase
MELVAAIDLGGTSIKAALVDANLGSVHTVRMPTRRQADVVDVDQLGDVVDELSEHASRLGGTVCGTGVVTPGIVDGDLGVVRFAANLGWRNLPLRDRLTDRIKLPLRIGHDVRAGGLAEFTVGAAVGVRNAMFLPVGTGIAAALLVDGHELTASGFAGEIGHVVVDPGGAARMAAWRPSGPPRRSPAATPSGPADRFTAPARWPTGCGPATRSPGPCGATRSTRYPRR